MAWMRSGVRSPSAPQDIFFVITFTFALAGCSKSSPSNPAKDAAQREAVVDAGVVAAPGAAADAGPSSAPTGASAASCNADEDCQTWSSYCQEAPCVCRVYAKGEAEPRCSSAANVSCFVDPCMRKTAACQDGRCVLVMQPSR